MAAGFRLGIDFGTSHTVAVLEWPDGSVRPLLFDGSPLLLSGVYAGPDGLVTGRDAVHAARGWPGRFEPNPKRRVSDGTVLLGDAEFGVPDLIGAVLRRVYDEAARVAGAPVDTVTLTHPAGWGATRRGVLTAAAAGAGWPEVHLLAEPVAAAAHFGAPFGVIYDFGAGTFDASVVRHGVDGPQVLVTAGLDDVGGLDLDELIVARLRSVYGSRDPAGWLGAGRQIRDDARAAKEMLSRSASAPVHVPGAGGAHLGREEFEALAEPLLARTVAVTLDAIGAVDGRPTGLYLVGGSSRIPLVATLLHRASGIAPTVVEQPELVVALGSLRWRRELPVGVTVVVPPVPPDADADPATQPAPDGAPRPPTRRARAAGAGALAGGARALAAGARASAGAVRAVPGVVVAAWRRVRPFQGLLWTGAILASVITVMVLADDPPAGPEGAAGRPSSSGFLVGERVPVAEYPVSLVETVYQVRVTAAGAVVAQTGDASGNVNTLRIRDLTGGRVLLERQVSALLLGPDGSLCVQQRDLGVSQEVMLVDAAAGRDLGRLSVGGYATFGVDGATVAVWAPGQVSLYDPVTRERVRQVWLTPPAPPPPGTIEGTLAAVAVGPGAQVIAGLFQGGAVQVWNGTGAPVGAPKRGLVVASTETSDRLRISPDGTMVLAVDVRRKLRAWRIADGADLITVDDVAAAVFSPDSSMLAIGSQQGRVSVYPTGQAAAGPLALSADWRTAQEFRASDGPLSAMAFGPDGRTIVTAGHGEPVRAWAIGA